MNIAYKVSERSTCTKRKVGSVIVKNKKIISCGYNEPSSGLPNYTPETCVLDKNGKCILGMAQHSEVNACLFADPKDREGATLFCTVQPCAACSSVIINSGIKRVIYDQVHPPQIDKLKEANIPSLQLLEAIKQDIENC